MVIKAEVVPLVSQLIPVQIYGLFFFISLAVVPSFLLFLQKPSPGKTHWFIDISVYI